jgi:hypothetical protein
MSNRFDELEEKLRRLETVPIVSAGAQVRVAGPEEILPRNGHGALQSKSRAPVAAGPEDSALSERDGKLKRRAGNPIAASGLVGKVARMLSDLSALGWKRQVRVLQDQEIAQFQQRMHDAAGGAVKDARRQLEALADELAPSLQRRMENSVRTFATQLIRSVEHNIHGATQQNPPAAQPSMTAETADTACEWSNTGETLATGVCSEEEAVQKRLMQAFAPVVEEIQVKSTAFLDHINLQLHHTLQAFGEKATKHAAEQFQKIAVEVLQREAERLQNGLGRPDWNSRVTAEAAGSFPRSLDAGKISMAQTQTALPEVDKLPSASDSEVLPESQQRSARQRGPEKPSNTAPNWRILGLG